MNRRLPVYLLIDCSESMIGQGIEAVRAGLHTMLGSLRRDPHALESVCLSVITYDATARVECPLTPLIDFQEPQLVLRPGTSLGAGLSCEWMTWGRSPSASFSSGSLLLFPAPVRGWVRQPTARSIFKSYPIISKRSKLRPNPLKAARHVRSSFASDAQSRALLT